MASLALMALVTVQLGRAALVDGASIAIGVAGATLMVGARVNATLLIAGAAVAGLLVHGLR